jgi:hypothetical protein
MIAYTIPYKDKKLSEAEKSYNLTYELEKVIILFLDKYE